MPGPLPAKFDRLTVTPRDHRPTILVIRQDDLLELRRAVQNLQVAVVALAQATTQNFRSTASSIQAAQQAINDIIDHLTP